MPPFTAAIIAAVPSNGGWIISDQAMTDGPDDSSKKPEDMTPDELETFIQGRVDAHNQDKRIAYWSIYVPLARGWNVHFVRIKQNGVLKQYENVKEYCRIKFGNSHELFRLSVNAEQYHEIMTDAWAWLDRGCVDLRPVFNPLTNTYASETDPTWEGWRPKETYTPRWAKEVAEAYLNRMSPVPVKKTKAERDAEKAEAEAEATGEDDDGKLIEPMSVEQSTALLTDRLSEIARLAAELDYKSRRIEQLEDVLIEHRIPLPEAELTVEMKDLLDGLTADAAAEQIDTPPPSEQPLVDIPPDEAAQEEEEGTEAEIVPVIRSKRRSPSKARSGAGRREKPALAAEDSFEWVLAATESAWRDLKSQRTRKLKV